ncbi:hypothetical protein [Idiomarina aminovorans]|uniref:hypothetical protein n=1 Tax=Idiomarina aminovorans TaxID=2914829 RepID=UPI0020037E2F|nr:hypothetical protein [Idiomarina sp. ATCH4]MCK7458897.1 hypothetical protein [Idiomarina sp. ATCH4]
MQLLSRKAVPVLIGIIIVAISVTALLPEKTKFLRFEANVGKTEQYRLDMRTRILDINNRDWQISDTASLHSILHYRVDKTDSDINVRVVPQALTFSFNESVQFSSSNPKRNLEKPVRKLISSGFDQTMNRKTGRTTVSAKQENRDLHEESRQLVEQLQQVILSPVVNWALPMVEGKSVTLNSFQNIPSLVLKVDSIDENSITVDITKETKAPADALPVMGHDPSLKVRWSEVNGRMRISRDDGWIENLVLITTQKAVTGSPSKEIDTTLVLRRKSELVVGSTDDFLAPFEMATFLAENSGSYELSMSSTGEPPDFDFVGDPVAHTETAFAINPKDNSLELELDFVGPKDKVMGGLTAINSLTLMDKQGNKLNIPMMLRSIEPNYSGASEMNIYLVPLGWEKTDLSNISSITAVMDYMPAVEPIPVTLPLAKDVTSIQQKNAQASATPTDEGWIIATRSSDRSYYILDQYADYPGSSGRWSDKAFHDLKPSTELQLRRVDAPEAWYQQFVIKGNSDKFPLTYYQEPPEAEVRQVKLHFAKKPF